MIDILVRIAAVFACMNCAFETLGSYDPDVTTSQAIRDQWFPFIVWAAISAHLIIGAFK